MRIDPRLVLLLLSLHMGSVGICIGFSTPHSSPGSGAINSCPITFNKDLISGKEWSWNDTSSFFGTENLRVALGPVGVITVAPEMTGEDAWVRHKMPWFVANDFAGSESRPLRVSARQLDGDGQAIVHVAAPDSSGSFYPVTIEFSGLGCWEITGSVANETLTVIVIVFIGSTHEGLEWTSSLSPLSNKPIF